MTTLQPSAQEQYMLELINRARANPLAEVARNPQVNDLNQGLGAGTISTSAKQPLAFSLQLLDASRRHSQWMLNTGIFDHTGENGSSVAQRIQATGYSYLTAAENIAASFGTAFDVAIAGRHDGLFTSPGHRRNLMNPEFKEIGIGAVFATSGSETYITQKFATAQNSSLSFITGVVFTDGVSNDDFYTIGEGIGNVQVQAIRQSDQQVFSTSTYGSGGYQIPLSNGTYSLRFSGGTLNQTVTRTITINGTNVKVDIATDQLPSPVMNGTANADNLVGGDGDDTINAFAGNDVVSAGLGRDQVFGGQGQDTLNGQQGADILTGGAGNDALFGGRGHDTLIGANVNTATPGLAEIDTLTGALGGDRFVLGNTAAVFYNDGNSSTAGTTDYAFIADFSTADGDVIQLRGNASNYVLGSSPIGSTGTAIFLTTAGTNELIGVVQGVTGLSLNSSAFAYV